MINVIKGQRIFGLLTLGLGLLSLYMMFVFAPTEKSMGDVQRIMYAHIASAWVAYLSFVIVAIAGAMFLWKRKIEWDHIARASAELGVLFTTILLITGSLWGRAVWNAWWVWDPRLTTTLILWFIYVGYLLLRSSSIEQGTMRKVSALYGFIGLINIPLVHYSVTWWRSIHPYIIRHTEIDMPAEMVYSLIISSIFFLVLYVLLMSYRTMTLYYMEQIYQLKEKVSKFR